MTRSILVLAILTLAPPLRALPGQEEKALSATQASRVGDLDVAGGRIHYEVAGAGDVVVLLHDGLLHSVTWDDLFPALAQSHRVIRYDRRGYGLSPPAARSYSDVADLEALLASLGVARADVIGCSAGGALAIDFTLAHPKTVRSLILVGAVMSGFPYSEHFLTRGGSLPADRRAEAQTAEYWAERDPYYVFAASPAARARVRDLLSKFPQNLRHSESFRRPEPPALGHLSEIRVPTLVVVGESDIPDVHAQSGAMEAGIAGARRGVVARAGHVVQMEQPEVFNRLVADFLRSRKEP